ncbi:UNVERIFIED_CONTAM: Cullin-3A [Sesamum radiatum]|uniref:Cullin-3A n=1 Tax=Sesamum radiatum TaxID=300843 RepID=A0AAW2JR69_SESRA
MTFHLQTMSKCIEDAHGGSFLEELSIKWSDHNKALQMIRDILMYMDRTFIPSTHKTPVHELGLNLWRDNRADEKHNQNANGFGTFVYQEDFEKPFLEVSADFYRAESQEFIECSDCGDYLKKAERRLNEEIERVSQYLDAKSEAKITNVVEKEMIANHMLRLVHMENSGLVKMLLDDKFEDLGRMYNLFRRVPNGLSTIRDVMTSHIRDTGKQLVTDPEKSKNPVEFVESLLEKRDKYDKIISLAFSNDKTFQNALNSSFEYFINLNPRSPEYISLFVDDKLRKGLKGVKEEDIETILDKVMMLFRYLQEKDVFEKYYKQHLAKRLLSGKTVSDDAERSLIVKLKTECGYQFTSKLEGMFTDMKTSQDTMQGFYAAYGAELGNGPTLVVQVLTTGSWPTQSSITCNLPSEMSALCEKFRSYYLGTHTGRRLSWQTNMGTADLRATFGNGQKYELNVSTYQMCVLMLFNNADYLSYREIEQATEIPPSDLKRCLQSLACVKGKNVLRKEPMSKDIGEDDAFSVNDKFTSKLRKVKIGTVVAQKESEPEKQETRQRVEEDRKPQIEAAIVRIMNPGGYWIIIISSRRSQSNCNLGFWLTLGRLRNGLSPLLSEISWKGIMQTGDCIVIWPEGKKILASNLFFRNKLDFRVLLFLVDPDSPAKIQFYPLVSRIWANGFILAEVHKFDINNGRALTKGQQPYRTQQQCSVYLTQMWPSDGCTFEFFSTKKVYSATPNKIPGHE